MILTAAILALALTLVILDLADEKRKERQRTSLPVARHPSPAQAVYRRGGTPALDADGCPPYEVRREYLESA